MNGRGAETGESAERRISLAVFALATVAMLALSGLGYLAYTEYLVPGYERLVFDVPMSADGRVRCRGYMDGDGSRVVSWNS